MNPEKIIGIATIALAPVVIVSNATRSAKDKISQAKCDRAIRKYFKAQDKIQKNK